MMPWEQDADAWKPAEAREPEHEWVAPEPWTPDSSVAKTYGAMYWMLLRGEESSD